MGKLREGGMNMKIIHIMADGTVRDSIEGLVVPPSIGAAYQILANHVSGEKKKEAEKESVGSAGIGRR